MARNYMQGKLILESPEKYAGDANNVVYRSSWEKRFMLLMERSPYILKWSSEEVVIPYVSPLDNKFHRYYMDFAVWTKAGMTLIEVKPYKQTVPPISKKGKRKKTLEQEIMAYIVNQAKWNSTMEICRKKGMGFKIATDKRPDNFPKSEYPTWEIF